MARSQYLLQNALSAGYDMAICPFKGGPREGSSRGHAACVFHEVAAFRVLSCRDRTRLTVVTTDGKTFLVTSKLSSLFGSPSDSLTSATNPPPCYHQDLA
jgi:hypothetical protein